MISPKQTEILWEDGGLVDQPWLQLFALWAAGHTDELDFQQNPAPHRLQALLEARARLAEVEAERDEWKDGYFGESGKAAAESRLNVDLAARLAEAEADAVESVAMYRRCRDQRDKYRARAESAEARLAEVEALAFEINAVDYSDTRIERIRALLRGEGDRPAERHAFYPTTVNGGGKVACGVWLPTEGRMCKRSESDPIHSGEGDRG